MEVLYVSIIESGGSSAHTNIKIQYKHACECFSQPLVTKFGAERYFQIKMAVDMHDGNIEEAAKSLSAPTWNGFVDFFAGNYNLAPVVAFFEAQFEVCTRTRARAHTQKSAYTRMAAYSNHKCTWTADIRR